MISEYRAEILDPQLPGTVLGEGPFWCAQKQRLSWVDIKSCKVHLYDPVVRHHEKFSVPKEIGFALPDADGRFLCGLKNGLYWCRADGNHQKILATDIPENVRFNDGQCDAKGRLWCGTIPLNENEKKAAASLYCYDGHRLNEIETDISISNGIGWSPDSRFMYHIDTGVKTVWRYDYDIESGAAKGRHEFIKIEHEGSPDGMCVAPDGNLYIALYGGGEILIVSPEAVILSKIKVPVPNVTSCIFGGSGLKTLFITTAADGLSESELSAAPLSGHIFKYDF